MIRMYILQPAAVYYNPTTKPDTLWSYWNLSTLQVHGSLHNATCLYGTLTSCAYGQFCCWSCMSPDHGSNSLCGYSILLQLPPPQLQSSYIFSIISLHVQRLCILFVKPSLQHTPVTILTYHNHGYMIWMLVQRRRRRKEGWKQR